MTMLSERRPPTPSSGRAAEPLDRCRFGGEFDRATVECPAFQRTRFINATSYGKPLGTHVACAHLLVGELNTNQFYPRCSLGSEFERMRWLAMMGPGRIEVLRALNAEFETLYADSLRQLVAAKAAALADPPDDRAGRRELAAVVRGFVSDLTAFVNANADRIAEIGISPTDLTARAAWVLGDWQHSPRLDLPGLDEETILRPEPPAEHNHAEIAVSTSLAISRTSQPASVILVGSIDQAHLDGLDEALNAAVSGDEACIIDLSAVTFCSVAGLRMLARAAQSGHVTLAGMQPQLQRALIAAGLPGANPVTPVGGDLEVAS